MRYLGIRHQAKPKKHDVARVSKYRYEKSGLKLSRTTALL
jgi:hypothetical protein